MADGKDKRARRRKNNSNSITEINNFLSFGGTLKVLSESECESIHKTVLQILSEIGLSEISKKTKEVATNAGAFIQNDRLCFPKAMIEEAIAGLSHPVILHGQKYENDLQISGKEVYFGTGGATPTILDHKTNQFRETTLTDLFDNARLIDKLENVDFFSRTVIARDIKSQRDLDLNTMFASLRGTTKHVMTSVSNANDVKEIRKILDHIQSEVKAKNNKNLISLNTNHVVSPLRFDPDSCDVLIEGVKSGIPINVNTFAQVGASSVVTLAGAVAQTLAETMAGMILGWLVDKNATLIFGPRPMITDLRTGAISGGSAEQPIATAMAGQMAQFYGFANSAISGATDSKAPDSQASFEKAANVQMAALSGVNLITQACGSLASLMATSFTASVIDNDMLGVIRRSCGKLEINKTTLGLDSIKNVVNGDGHFLGQPETYDRMRSDYLYPNISDRQNYEDWIDAGSPDIVETAKNKVTEILTKNNADHLQPDTIKSINELI